MSHAILREAVAVTSWFLLDFQTCWEPTVAARVQRQLLPFLSVLQLACLMADSEKKTTMWPTKFPKHKRLMPVLVLKMKDIVDTV